MLNDHQNDQVESIEPLSDRPDYRAWAVETIAAYHESYVGSIVSERLNHRGWPVDVTLAFMSAPIVKPAQGEIARRLGYSK